MLLAALHFGHNLLTFSRSDRHEYVSFDLADRD
jgi:hypothetical protein